MRTVPRVLLLLTLSTILLACSPPKEESWVYHNHWSAETRFVEKWPNAEPSGLGVGFVRPADRNSPPNQRPSTELFHIEKGRPFSTLLMLGIGYKKVYPVVVSVFLDYKQIRFSLDGRQGRLHYLEIGPDKDMEIPLQVPIKTSGWHDLFVLVIPHPQMHPLDPRVRMPPSSGVGGRRTVICAGDCSQRTKPLPAPLVGSGTTVRHFSFDAYPLLPGDWKSTDQRVRHLLLVANVRPGEDFSFNLWARNADGYPKDYVVLPLIDFKQIPCSGVQVFHLHMPSGSELITPCHIRVPSEPEIHEFQLVYIHDPYQKLRMVRDPFVRSAVRSALVAKTK